MRESDVRERAFAMPLTMMTSAASVIGKESPVPSCVRAPRSQSPICSVHSKEGSLLKGLYVTA